jgi:hypothetical protein
MMMSDTADGAHCIVSDPASDVIDDMAALCEHWTRNREDGRTPKAIKEAMIFAARELIALADQPAPEDSKAHIWGGYTTA